jgi:hypothetical protein
VTVLMRQNKAYNQALIQAARPALTFVQGELMVHEVLQALTTPLLDRFLALARAEGARVARQAREQLEAAFGERVPFVWTFECDPTQPGMAQALASADVPLRVGELLIDPRDPGARLAAVPLMLSRGARSAAAAGARARWLPPGSRARTSRRAGLLGAAVSAGQAEMEVALPAPDTPLGPGDRLLFAGEAGVEALQQRFLLDPSPIVYVRTGVEPARSWVFRRLAARRVSR